MDKAKIGGILSLVAGGIGILVSLLWLVMLLLITFFMTNTGGMPHTGYDMYPANMMFGIWIVFYSIMIFVMLIASALAITGGVYALRRKYWGLCLAGSIGSVISFFPCGIAALIFIIMGKEEF
jgi:hypothetical protein